MATVIRNGSSIRVVSKDGTDGTDGTNGTNGVNGKETFPGLAAASGGTDRTAEINALGTTPGYSLSAGSYPLTSAPAVTDTVVLGLGATFPGPYYLPGQANGDILNNSGMWSVRTSFNGFANYTSTAQLVARPSGSHTRKFESAAHIAAVVCYDSSTYVSDGDTSTPGVELSARDYVGNDSSVLAPGGLNLTRVRMWGANQYVKVGNSAADNGTVDGQIIGTENRIDNWGADSGEFSTATQKFGVTSIAGGNKALTAGYMFIKGADLASAYYGSAIQGSACTRYAYSVLQLDAGTAQNALWGVLPGGAMEMKGIALPATPAAGRTRVYLGTGGAIKAVFDDGSSRQIAHKDGSGSFAGLVANTADYRGTAFRATGATGASSASGGAGLEMSVAGGVPNLLSYNRTTNAHIPMTIAGLQLILNFGTTAGKALTLDQTFANFANDAAAATGGVPVNGVYRNGSVLMVRVA